VGLDPVADAVEPTLRVLVELGYDRETPYGVHTTVGIAPRVSAPEVVSGVRESVAQGAASVRASVANAVRTPSLGRASKVSDESSLERVPLVSDPELKAAASTVKDEANPSYPRIRAARESVQESVRKVTVRNKTPDSNSGSEE
jgi:hypothetical protein